MLQNAQEILCFPIYFNVCSTSIPHAHVSEFLCVLHFSPPNDEIFMKQSYFFYVDINTALAI